MSKRTNKVFPGGRVGRSRPNSLRSYLALFLTPLLAVLAIGVLAPASALAANGSITGTVTDSSTSLGISGIKVNLEETTQGNVVQSATTDSSGNYTFTAVPDASDYVVEFNPSGAGTNPNFSNQFYQGATTFGAATTVTVTGTSATSNINAALDPVPGTISGTVTDASTHGALGDITVEVQNASGDVLGQTTTANDGTYTLSNVPAGNDYVVFNVDNSQDFVTQYYNNKPSLATADPVAVTGGATTTAIDGALVPASGHITGTVTNASTSAAVADVQVVVLDSTGQDVGEASTGADGTYTVTGLATGTYEVRFQAPSGDDLAPQYYNGKTGIATADSVSVTTGATTPGINAALTAGATISGRVTNSAGAALQSASVTIVNCDSPGFFACPGATTAADGTYTIQGLAPGNYYVRIDGPNGQNFLTQYYNSSTTESGATPVAATAGATTTVNQALPAGGQISGRVTDSSGNPAAGVQVEAQDASGNSIADAVTAADGTYTIMGLDTASYRLEFFGGSKFVTDYYNNAATLGTATPVSVTRGATTGSINTALPSAANGGRISGTVTGSNGLPISGISVTVYDTAGNAVISMQTSSDGSYRTGALLPGTYKVGFAADGVNLAFQYYSAQNSLAAANTVTVTAGTTKPNINATMVIGASVTGTVTDATSHTTLGGVEVDLLDSTGHVLDSASTRPDGTYDLTGIPTGSFHVKFQPGGLTAPGGALYAVQYYNNKPALAGSDAVATTAGSTVGNINAALATEGAAVITPAGKPGAPTISGTSLSGISKRKATLKFTVAAGSNAPSLKSFTVKLPKGLSFVKKGLKKGLKITGGGKYTDKISKGKLVVTLKTAAAKISVKISSKAISVSKKLAKSAKKHKDKTLKVTVSVTDASGTATTLTHTFKKPR